MYDRWHFYCDESGDFEKIGRFDSILVGMLIPEANKAKLAEKYLALKKKHNIEENFVHATKMHKSKNFKSFKDELIQLTLASPVRLLRMQYQEDMLDESAGEISESFACNRYLYMIEALLEHILFYQPDDYGKSLTFAINPNSRVFPCSDGQVSQMRALGFNVFKPKGAKSHLVQVWDAAGLRVFLSRLQLEHSIYAAVSGERQVAAVDLKVAWKSEDPFVHWSDVITWQLMWRPEEASTRQLVDFLYTDAIYGNDNRIHKALCRLFLAGRHKEFIEQYLHSTPNVVSPYYRRRLGTLFDKGVNEMGAVTLDDLSSMETMADESLRRSRGNWQFVSKLVDKLFEIVDIMPEAEARLEKTKWLKFRLNNHRLSYHNHRGEVLPAWQAAARIDALGLRPRTVNQWRTRAEYQNRRAVTHANLFSFEEGNRSLVAAMECLEQTLECLNACAGMTLQDDILGKLRGTVAQNLAFLAPFQPESFQHAEKMFLAAKAQFDKPADRLRQNIYLAHLYIDAGQHEKLMAVWAEIEQNPAVMAFWGNPTPETAESMQFVVALQLKIAACVVKQHMGLLKRYRPLDLKSWFGQAADEHPFELIHACLGQLAFACKDLKAASSSFRTALSVPDPSKAPQQVTIEAIRAQILVRWALCLKAAGDEPAAGEKIRDALAIMARIGQDPDCRPMLGLEDGRPAAGWFKDGYQALLDAGGKVDIEACRTFLRCFTFNYW